MALNGVRQGLNLLCRNFQNFKPVLSSNLLNYACRTSNINSINREFHLGTPTLAKINVRSQKPTEKDGSEGLAYGQVDLDDRGFGELFPDETTPATLHNGVRFDELPIVYIRVSKHNTKMSLMNHKYECLHYRTCGQEGFKNARKRSTLAVQSVGNFISEQAFRRGINDVRVQLNGYGIGRQVGAKGLAMAGLNVVCIQDLTPTRYSFSPRPRKKKRL